MNIASALSGLIEVGVSHPLDRIKTEMQILTLNNSKTTISSTVKHIYCNGGLKDFYSGIIPRFIGIIPMRLIYWSSMTLSSEYINNNKLVEFSIIKSIFPGVITGIAQSIIDNPIEVAKIKIMTGSSNIKISNLFLGFNYLLVRNILFAIPVAYSVKNYGKENPFLAGALGGLIGSIISHPFDVIKTERQRNKSNKDFNKVTLIKMLKKNPLDLYSGLTMRCSLSFVNMGVGFVVFNYLYGKLLNLSSISNLTSLSE
jgi:solute carrier family 25 2-oxodicarboxylate transporter 21